ncbi:hypothetical protein ABBQ32_003118 [Trebouxia sp. C0010 RCD-2024]
MAQQPIKAKLNYKPKSSIEVFYSGGAVSLSKNGLLACACQDDIKIVDTLSGAVVNTLSGDSEGVSALAFSPSGKHLFSGSRSLQQKWWDVEQGTCLRSWKGHRAPVLHMAVDGSGGLLATASADKSAKVWDIEGGFCTHSFSGHSGVVLQVLFQAKQLTLVTSGDDADVRVWDLVSKSCVAVLKGHYSAVTSLSLAPDGWSLISGGRDKVVHLWDLRKNTKLVTIPVYEAVEGAVVIPSDKGFPGTATEVPSQAPGKRPVFFATGGESGRVKIWSSATAQCVYEHLGLGTTAGGNYTAVAMLPGHAGLMAATADCNLLFLQPKADGSALDLTKQLIGNNDEVTDMRFLGPPAAPTHIAVSSNSETIRVFSLADMSCSASLAGHTDTVLALDAAPLADGARAGAGGLQTVLASGGKDNQVRVWECGMGRCLGVGEGHVAAVSAVAFTRRSAKHLVSAGADKLLKVWNMASALETLAASPIEGSEAPMAKLKATAATSAHDKDINAIAVAPNDSLICTASQDRTAKIWRLPDLVLVNTLRGHKRGVWAAQFSPADQAVATASGDKTLRLWALADGTCLKTFEGHTASVLRLSFVSAGTQLLSSGADGLVKLWNVRSTECLNTFDGHEDKVWAMTVGGFQEGLVATGGGDARVQIWEDCTLQDKAEAAEEEEATLLKQQRLSNALQDKDFTAAAQLAFELKQPGRLLAVVNMACQAGPTKAHHILTHLVGQLSEEELKLCLEYLRDWNTNSRHCAVAQAMLQAILVKHRPQVLLKIPGMQDLLEALLSYTQRHFVRMDRLVRSTFLLDYTLASMNVLMPDVGTDSHKLPAFEQPEAPGTDVDGSSGTDVDTDAFMQPAVVVHTVDVRTDGGIQLQAGVEEQQQVQAVNDSLDQQEDVGKVQEEMLGGHEAQQQLLQKAKSAMVSGSKRRKSEPQPVQKDAAALKAGSQTAVKVKRKKLI